MFNYVYIEYVYLTNKNLSVFYIANMLLDDKELKKNIRNIRNRYKKIKT